MKLLAISKAGFTPINRDIFEVLTKRYGYQIKLVIPQTLVISNKELVCDIPADDPNDISALPFVGTSRTSRYKGLYKVLEEFCPDIVYFEDDPITLLASSVGWWCKRNNKKFVCRTNQNRQITMRSEISRKGLMKGVASTALRRALFSVNRGFIDHLLTISNDGVAVFKQLHFNNVSRIPLGFNEDKFRIDEDRRRVVRKKMSLDGVVISYIGRITEGKGIHLLIDALGQLKNHQWTFLMDRFELYADDYRKKIRELIDAHQISERTVFFDAGHDEIADYMNATDIIVVPSITTKTFKEEYGRVAPEGMASGCLVITSDAGTLPELVGDAGWVFPEGDLSALISMLIKGIHCENRNEIGKKAAAYAHEHLGLNKQAHMMNEVFQKVVTQRR